MTRLIPLFLLCLLLLSHGALPPRIWMVGDSTMAAKRRERHPESGWGEGLAFFLRDSTAVRNRAASGRSTRSFIAEKRWQAVLDSLAPGDYVVIQFGHNDEKPDSLLHTDPATSYKDNLRRLIAETRTRGGIPVLCSPIVRRHFDSAGRLKDTHGAYPAAARQAALETGTPFIDMEASSRALLTELGPEGSKSLFLFGAPGDHPQWPRGVQDSTRLNQRGARVMAALFATEVKKQKLPLAKLLKRPLPRP